MKRAKQKNYPELTLEINKLSHDGRGIATIDGKTTFIHGALPGEKILAKITYQHRRYNEGKTLEVIHPSPNRTTPACKHFGVCGGCSLQHLAMDEQLQFKQNVLLEQLEHFGNVKPEELLPPLSGNPTQYRGKARLGVRYVIKKEKLLVGFREKDSNYLAELDACPILRSNNASLLTDLSQLIRSLSEYDQIPQIELAVGDNTTALVFRHLEDLPQIDLDKLAEFGKQQEFDIYLQPNPPAAVNKLFPKNSPELLTYKFDEFNIEMQFHPLMFTQVNAEMNPRMVRQAIQLLDLHSDDNVLDLFCGLGNFTLPIAKYAKRVVGIEGSEQMTHAAKENALQNNINNTEFYAANLMSPHENDTWLNRQYGKILLDPPRSGAKEIIPYFKKLAANRIVYVSCNPATLARDAGILVNELGYRLKMTGIINMFPHTSHIEAMALFTK